MELKNLEVYKLAAEISDEAWEIYQKLNWQEKKIIGDQFITAIDSIGANIVEGFGRFHYLDKNKFNYNARGSLFESIWWTESLSKRKIIGGEKGAQLTVKLNNLGVKLNNYISATKRQLSKK